MTDKIKNKLIQSIKAESDATKQKVSQILDARFAKADAILSDKGPKKRTVPKAERNKVYTFSMPPTEHDDLFNKLKDRTYDLRCGLNMSELARVGLHALLSVSDSDFKKIVESLKRSTKGRRQ